MEEGEAKAAVTFDSLRTVQRRERDSPALSQLPDNFYSDVAAYLSEKEGAIRQAHERGGSFSEKIADQHRKELSNAKDVFHEIVSRRSRKILTMAWEAASAESVIDTSPLAPAESKLFEEAAESVKKFSDSLFSAERPKVERESLKNEMKMKVKILQALPVFVGADMKSYGPFKEGELAELPKQNANMLISKERAEKV